MRVFITGGLGQIGSHTAELLLERGDQVLVVDNLSTGRIEHLAEHKNLTVIIDSIANAGLLDRIMGDFKPDVVLHTAASYKNPDDWYNDTLTNCVGGSNIIRSAINNSVKRFIYLQTALCYGLIPEHQPIDIDHTKNPASTSYAITKTVNEDLLEISNLNYVTFRLANVVGPRNLVGPLPIFYHRLKHNIKCYVTDSRRDFVHVSDLAKVILMACDGVGRGAYNFSSGKDISIKELYDSVVSKMAFEVYPKPDIVALGSDDTYSILLDPNKTIETFGTIDFTPIQQIVSDAVDYYDIYGTIGEYTHLKNFTSDKRR